jgi:hypothetical protein
LGNHAKLIFISMMGESPQKVPNSRTWFLVGLALVFLRGLPNLRYPLGRDQATYCVIGQGLLHGQLLYRNLWDNKPPGIFYVYALIVKVFGPAMWCVGVVDILWLLAISCCIFFFARRYLGPPAAALAMVFNAVRHCRQGYIHAAQPEAFLMLCVFGAWFLLRRGAATAGQTTGSPASEGVTNKVETAPPFSSLRPKQGFLLVGCLATGLILGAAFWLKYNAVAFFPFLLLVPFLDFHPWDNGAVRPRLKISRKDWLVRMLLVAAGFVLAILGVVAYFWVAGAWPAMKEVQFEVLPRYGAGVFHWDFAFLVWALRQSQFHLGFLTEIMVPLSLLIAWRRREVALLAPALLMALAAYIAAAMQGRFFPYYFETCYTFFSMFWGYVCVKTWQGFQHLRGVFRQHKWGLARAMLWLVLAGLVISLLSEESVRVAQQYRFLGDWWRNPEASYRVYWWQLPLDKLSDQLRVINYLKKNSGPDDEVYVWGTAPLINFLAQRRNPSRFVSNLGLISTWGPESWRRELVRTLETKRPRYVVVVRNDEIPIVSYTMMDSEKYLRVYPALADLLKHQYQSEVNLGDFEIYRLK